MGQSKRYSSFRSLRTLLDYNSSEASEGTVGPDAPATTVELLVAVPSKRSDSTDCRNASVFWDSQTSISSKVSALNDSTTSIVCLDGPGTGVGVGERSLAKSGRSRLNNSSWVYPSFDQPPGAAGKDSPDGRGVAERVILRILLFSFRLSVDGGELSIGTRRPVSPEPTDEGGGVSRISKGRSCVPAPDTSTLSAKAFTLSSRSLIQMKLLPMSDFISSISTRRAASRRSHSRFFSSKTRT